MLPQTKMIDRLRQCCQQDRRMVAAMLYGSFTRGEADQYSDIDCYLFFADEVFPTIDQCVWVSQIAPVELYYHNEFGNGTAIFHNLVRAEFHFDPVSKMHQIEDWYGKTSFPSLPSTLLLDRTGQLTEYLQPLLGDPPLRNTPEEAGFLCNSLINWILCGTNVLARGEAARALEVLQLIYDHLLRAVRLVEGTSHRWIRPTTAAEQELSKHAYARFRACTTALDSYRLWDAYLAVWRWSQEIFETLALRYDLTLPHALIAKLDERLGDLYRKYPSIDD